MAYDRRGAKLLTGTGEDAALYERMTGAKSALISIATSSRDLESQHPFVAKIRRWENRRTRHAVKHVLGCSRVNSLFIQGEE